LKELNVEKVYDIEEGPHGYYIATDVGMFIWASDSIKKNRTSKFNQLPADAVISVFSGVDNFLWIGTENSGIYKHSETKNQLKKVSLSLPDGKPMRARFFVQDIQGNTWISTIGQGVFKLDKNDAVLSHLSTEVGFIHNDIFAIHPDRKGRVWFGSQGAGLARLDPDNSMHLLSQEGIFPSHDVNDITEDGDGNIWIATDGQGYFKFNESGFENVGESKDRLTAFIAGIAFNKQNRIWLAYRKGISYLDLRTGKQRDFTTKDGLQNNESYGSKIMVDSKDNVLICHESGITILNALKANSDLILKTYLTGVRVSFEQSVEVTPSKEQILASVFPPISLPYNQNHLTFDFTATSINYSGPIYYRYFIKEFESTWSPPITGHAVTYSSLNPGSYTLLVQATNNLEAWVDPTLEYHFTIQKPYWQKWWFYLLQITGICALFGSTYLLSRNEKTKTSILRVMVFTCLFIVFEFIQNLVEPIASNHIGQAPIFKSLINLGLAILLLPMEKTFRTFFAKHATREDLE
jgi:ligand-binding sensor domain-containing protein